MSNTTRANPFKGKAKAAGDGDFKTEVPSADTHDARVCAMIDLGTHWESFQGGPQEKKRKCFVVFELDEEMTGMKGVNHVIGVQYTLSFHEKAKIRQLAEAVTNEGKKFTDGSDMDLSLLVGSPCTVQITHEQGKGEKSDRTYARVGAIGPVAKKKQPGHFAGKREKASWLVGDSLDDLPDYLPRIYGEKVEEVIGRCLELTSSGAKEEEEEGEVGGDGTDDTPF